MGCIRVTFFTNKKVKHVHLLCVNFFLFFFYNLPENIFLYLINFNDKYSMRFRY